MDGPTPLIALDAVAIDTETTGLDIRADSAIEIGAVRIVSGVIRAEATYRSFIRSERRIDPAAVRIHGINEEKLRDAPEFQHVWRDFAAFTADALMIGHTVGFDLAILERQLADCGLQWRRPRLLDTQLLAQLVATDRGARSLDELADWLDVPVERRHSALGDAMVAAGVFVALIPLLRKADIWTVQEAEAACRKLTNSLDAYRRASWVEPIASSSSGQLSEPPPRPDLFAYRHRVMDVMTTPPAIVPPTLSIDEALSVMHRQQVSSLFVADGGREPTSGDTGIVTERDILRAFSRHKTGTFDLSVGQLMSRPLNAVASESFAHLAIARMRRLRIRHLAVVDERDHVVGAVSARDLLRMHGEPAVLFGDEVATADDVRSLSRAWARLPAAVSAIMSDVPVGDTAGLISQGLAELTARVAVLAERALAERGCGPPPCPYALVVLGSAGRGESLLAADQDNALIFDRGSPGGDEDRWFAALGREIADLLHAAGIPYCPGGIMARNAAWRGSVQTWEHRIDEWINRCSPEDLLSIDVFFDMKPVHGDARLALSVWHGAFENARDNAAFAKALVSAASAHMAKGLTWFGTLRVSGGRIDLKRSGTFKLVTAARALAVRHHVVARSTRSRLSELMARKVGHEIDIDRYKDAFDLFNALMLNQQVVDIGRGLRPGNAVVVQALQRYEREKLRQALLSVATVEDFVRDLLF